MRHASTPLADLAFRLRLQHSHDLVTGAVVAAEAWPAWHRAGRPFPAAAVRDRAGAVHALLRAASEHAAAGGVPIGINAEAGALADGTLAEAARAALGATHCPPGRVAVEISEPVLDAVDPAPLHTLGLRLVADHYGSGPMSLRLLAGLPLAAVKLDAGVVREIDRAPRQQALVRAIAAMARAHGMALSACGIETEAERATLARLGVAAGQGPLFATRERQAA